MARARVEVVCPVCGETHKWIVFKYNRRDADEFEKRFEGTERLCEHCYNEKKMDEIRKKKDELKKNILDLNVKYGFVDLVGSEKQISWANEIRYRSVFENNFIKFKKIVDNWDSVEDDIREDLKEAVNGYVNAKWWIEHRDCDLRGIVYNTFWAVRFERLGKVEDSERCRKEIEELLKS